MKPPVYVTRRLPEPALQSLLEVCEVEIWDEDVPPPYEVIVEKVADKEALLCLLTDRIDAALMDAAPRLKVISQCAVGYDNIDVSAATARGIPVGNTPGVLTDATADFAFTLLMAAARRVGEAIEYVRQGRWQTWGLTLLLGQSVYGATLGIVGLGRIGQALARRARGFDMTILYHDAVRQPEAEAELGVEYRSLEDLLRESDFVSLHISLTEETERLIDAQKLALMKPTAILVNTSRGPVVDSEALYEALRDGQIGYAALDVTDPEPLPADHKLLTLPNLIVAPHIASATVTSRSLMAERAVRNLIAGLRGERLPYCANPQVYS
ncbi:MAG: 2-hydroxyacid dehydrogenase [Anaerolineae bacterium]